jgi:transposase-like protein
MCAPRKYEQEFCERAVRMYRERLAEPGESKRGARRYVGALLDLNPETLRNWAEERDRVESGRSPAPRTAESEEVRALRRRVSELERANEILKTSAAFSPRRSLTADFDDRGLHRLPPRVVRRRADLCGPGRGWDRNRAVHLLRPPPGSAHRTEMDDAYLANQLRSLWQDNWGVYGARKLWHAARRAGHDLGRDQVARLMRLAGIAGTVCGRHRTMTTQRDQTAPRHPDLVKRGWHAPTGSTSCGWPTSPMCGRWPVSSTSHSLSTCSPDGSWAGGSPPPNTPAWSLTRCGRRYRSAAAPRTGGSPRG